ncbi:unnamed protein product [Brassica rapa]|uniref:Transmembrane protein n=2 Tax=Brassica TaxID=3705 RepID=A0A8D9GRJ9_BRACM|nr:unnamed protein product [Brassica napus]CAG7885219.1 unnamed protein product [Brassica rapa]
MGSFKYAFIVLLVLTVVISVTVQISEAKLMLQEEKSLPLLDLQVSKLVNPQMVGFCNYLRYAAGDFCIKIS